MNTEEFKEIQKQLGVTNKQLGDALGISRRAVDYIRSGETVITKPIARHMLEFQKGKKL